jgi:hypothetical protein
VLELESRPPQGGLAYTVSLAPGAAVRRPPRIVAWAWELMISQPPTGDGRSSAHLVSPCLLAIHVWGYLLLSYMVEKDRVTLSCAPKLSSRSVLSLLQFMRKENV